MSTGTLLTVKKRSVSTCAIATNTALSVGGCCRRCTCTSNYTLPPAPCCCLLPTPDWIHAAAHMYAASSHQTVLLLRSTYHHGAKARPHGTQGRCVPSLPPQGCCGQGGAAAVGATRARHQGPVQPQQQQSTPELHLSRQMHALYSAAAVTWRAGRAFM
jgi:hypothetical protein